MRIFTIILTILFLFCSTLANAWVVPIVRTATSILVRKSDGVAVKVGKTAFYGWSGVQLCKSIGFKACKKALDLADDVFDFDDDDTADCSVITIYSWGGQRERRGAIDIDLLNENGWYSSYFEVKNFIKNDFDRINESGHYKFVENPMQFDYQKNSQAMQYAIERYCPTLEKDHIHTAYNYYYQGFRLDQDSPTTNRWGVTATHAIYKKDPDKIDKYNDYIQSARDKDLFELLKDKIDDDKFDDIAKKYPNQVNIDKYCANLGACIELESEFASTNPNPDDIDDSCKKRNGKVYSCDKDDDDDSSGGGRGDDSSAGKDDKSTGTTAGKDDDDDSSGGGRGDDDDSSAQKKDDDDDLTCNSSKFHKKICDWIDWTQKDYDKDDSTKIDIDEQDIDGLKKDRIDFDSACPAPYVANYSFAGVSKTMTVKYDNLCIIMIKLKPFLVGISGIIGIMIISGRSK